MTIRQEYRKFLNDNFKGLIIRQPLFYNWDYGLRFDLQVGETNTDEYFKEVQRRSIDLFHSVFYPNDNLFFILMDYKYGRRKIRFTNFAFRQISNLQIDEVFYTVNKRLYEPSDKFDIYNSAIIKLSANRLGINNILSAIGNADFPPRQPRLDGYGFSTNKQIYLINIDRRIIFNMYDDRGLDIISSDLETIQPIYQKYNNWILDCDRERIDKIMNKNGL